MIIGVRLCSVAAKLCGASKIDKDGAEIMIDWLWAISIDEFRYSEYLSVLGKLESEFRSSSVVMYPHVGNNVNLYTLAAMSSLLVEDHPKTRSYSFPAAGSVEEW